MKIVVDCLAVKREQGGIRSVAVNLTLALSRIDGLSVTVLSTAESDFPASGRLRFVTVDLPSNGPITRLIWRKRRMRSLIEEVRADIIFTVTPEFFKNPGTPHVIMVHDLGPLLAPGLYGRQRFFRYAASIRHSVNKADAVVCVSGATKMDLIRWCGTEVSGKLSVVLNAGQRLPGLLPRSQDTVPSNYCLYVGSYLKHKNVISVLRAFASGLLPSSLRLVCVGPDYAGEKHELLDRYSQEEWLTILDFVSEEELRGLYARAKCIVFPSLFEGFGLPVVEALQLGGHVVATRLTVLEELVGDEITYVDDPVSADEWASAINAEITKTHPCGRSGTAHAVLQRDWNLVAREIMDVLDDVCARQEVAKGA